MPDVHGSRRVPVIGIRLPALALTPDDTVAFANMARLAETAEASGFDALWVGDGVRSQVAGTADGRDGDDPVSPAVVSEPYSLLGALAVRTGSIRLASFADGADLREPSLVAKAAAAIDVISHGRFVLALGSGPCEGTAAERLEEKLRICRELLTIDGGPASFDGRHHRVHGAPNLPRPVQRGGVPLVVVAGGDCVLPTAALHADAVVLGGDPGGISRSAGTVRDACEAAGRPGDSVCLLWAGAAPDAERSRRSVDAGLAGLVEAGVSGWIVSFPSATTSTAIERAATVLRAALDAS